MKVKTITYSKVFPLGSYVNEKVGVEVEMDETEDWNEVFEDAKNLVNSWGTKPQLTDGEILDWATKAGIGHPLHSTATGQPIPTKDIAEERPHRTEERIIDQIEECTDLVVLKSFELLAKKNPHIWNTYLSRREYISSLTNSKTTN